jgi:hypothetical protein
MLYFRKVNVNQSTGSASIIVTDAPIESKQTKLLGINVATRTQSNVTFGVLSLIDPETNTVMRANHPGIKQLQKQLNPGDEMPGFKLSDNPVIDVKTGEQTSLMWATAE